MSTYHSFTYYQLVAVVEAAYFRSADVVLIDRVGGVLELQNHNVVVSTSPFPSLPPCMCSTNVTFNIKTVENIFFLILSF